MVVGGAGQGDGWYAKKERDLESVFKCVGIELRREFEF